MLLREVFKYTSAYFISIYKLNTQRWHKVNLSNNIISDVKNYSKYFTTVTF